MKAVDDMLYNALTGDSAPGGLMTMVSGVFRHLAPQEQAFPYVVYQQQAGTDAYTLASRNHRRLVYLVKVVAQGMSAATSYTANDRIDALLTDQALSISGYTLLYIRRESDIEFSEELNGVVYQHVGALYEIYVR